METVKTIIDTDLLIDLLRNQKQAVVFIEGLEQKNYLFVTTAINIFELHLGAHKSEGEEKKLQAITVLTSRFSILPFTSKAAQKAGHIYAQLEGLGHPIGLRDTFIASIAIIRDYSLATRNHMHFNRIPGLKVITP